MYVVSVKHRVSSDFCATLFIVSDSNVHPVLVFVFQRPLRSLNLPMTTKTGCIPKCNRTPLIRTLVIRIGLALRANLSRILKKRTCLEITCCRIKYSTVLWLLELQIRRGRKIQTQVHTVNSNSRTSNYQYSLFSKKKKNLLIWIFCICGWFAVPINPDKWSSTVL